MTEILESVQRQTRDVRAAAATLSHQEARYLVDQYYVHQEMRIAAAHRARKMDETGEPHSVLDWLEKQGDTLEAQIKGSLQRYAASHPVGQWAMSNKGIGPVISAGYIANISITADGVREGRMSSVGKLWANCGVAPGKDRRKRGEKATFNPTLQRLTWITGKSFEFLSSDDPKAFYRHIYDARKVYELAKNAAGDYAEQAARTLVEKKFTADTVAKKEYEAGRLPGAHINARARRYAAKMFLSHLHKVWWDIEIGDEIPYPLPYSHAHLGHIDMIWPPNWPME